VRAGAIWLLVLTAATTIVAGCGSNAGSKPSTDAVSTATRTEADTETDSSNSNDQTDDDQPTKREIEVAEPTAFSSVYRSFTLAGTAAVFEGALAWEILDEQLKPMQRGMTTATCGAPCRGKFSTTVRLQGVAPGSWELHVFAPPVDPNDPPRVHDTILPITVTTGPIGDAAAADAPPPGGVPNS
jgi:hypothetical protein